MCMHHVTSHDVRCALAWKRVSFKARFDGNVSRVGPAAATLDGDVCGFGPHSRRLDHYARHLDQASHVVRLQ